MNRIIVFLLVLGLGGAMATDAQAQRDEVSVTLASPDATLSYPLSVMTIINNKCYGCHSPDARNDKSKEALQWKDLQNMEPIDLLGMMDEVIEVLDEGSMPPEKIVEKYPDMKLSDAEVATLRAWAEQTMAKLDE